MVTEQTYTDMTGTPRKRRLLRFNDRVESAIWIDNLDENSRPKKYESAVRYTALLHMGVPFAPEAKSALFIGLGGGVGPTEFHNDYGMDVDAVDIDSEVLRIAQQWFFLKPSDTLRLHVADGRGFLTCSDKKRDIIVLDAYSSGGSIPFHLITEEFYELVREHLNPGGVMVSNLISSLDGKGSAIFKSSYKTQYSAGFQNVYVFPRFNLKSEPYNRVKDDYFRDQGMNIITVATLDPKRFSVEELTASARQLIRNEEGRPVLPRFTEYIELLYRVEPFVREEVLSGMKDTVILTDDFAPTDTMYAGF